MEFLTCQYSAPGGRTPNEDSVGSFDNGENRAWIAADGLGGHSLGEVASAAAVASLEKAVLNCNSVEKTFVEDTFRQMNADILALGGPLTTAVCAFTDGKKLWYANNGDSRFLFIRGKEIMKHTNDHSLAYVAYLSGHIEFDEIPNHPSQNRLFHSLGNEVDFYGEFYPSIDLKPGDAFLLATDGFWELIDNNEIIRSLNISPTPQEWMGTMLDIIERKLKANSDNYSAVCVIVR